MKKKESYVNFELKGVGVPEWVGDAVMVIYWVFTLFIIPTLAIIGAIHLIY